CAGLAIWGARHLDRFSLDDEAKIVLVGVLATIPLATAAIYLFIGALQMLRMRSYPFALAAAILAVIPWSPGWILGLPFGIWSLVVLSRKDVRAVFRDNWQRGYGNARPTGRVDSFLRSFGGYFFPTFGGGAEPSQSMMQRSDGADRRAADLHANPP